MKTIRGSNLFKLIFDKAWADVSNQKSYQNFCNFIEAILAYHRAIGGQKLTSKFRIMAAIKLERRSLYTGIYYFEDRVAH